eukprot:1160632-Pelagomonas_calceolata.AAC.16
MIASMFRPLGHIKLQGLHLFLLRPHPLLHPDQVSAIVQSMSRFQFIFQLCAGAQGAPGHRKTKIRDIQIHILISSGPPSMPSTPLPSLSPSPGTAIGIVHQGGAADTQNV